jgi:hypothetical protein
MSLRVFYEVLNQRGTPALFTDTFANRPAFGFQGRLFISTDTAQIFEDTGTAWTLIADGGGGVSIGGNITGATAGSVLFVGTSGVLAQDNSNFFWDDTNNRLGIGTTSPGASLDIHGSGSMVQLNGTSTNNSYLLFQNAGTGKWRIGNLYNAGANTFEIHDILNGINRLTILNTGATTLNGSFTLTGALTGTTASLLNSSASTGLDVASDKVIFRANTGVSTPRQVEISMGGATSTFLDAKGFGANYITDFGIRTYNSIGTAFNVFYGTSAGNVIIGGTTDAGFRFDCQGTARVNGNITLQSGSQKELLYDSQGIKIRHNLNGVGNNVIIGWSGGTISNEATSQRSVIIGFNNRGNVPTSSIILSADANLTSYGGSSAITILGGSVTLNASSGTLGNYIVCSGTVLGEFNGLFANDTGASELPTSGTNIPTIIGCPINSGTPSTPSIYLGQWGSDSTLPSSSRNVFVSATNGVGTNVEGYNLVFSSGRSTGSAISKDIYFSTSTPTTSGTTLQTLIERMRIFGGSGNVAINSNIDNGQGALQISGNIYVTGIGAAGSTYSVSSTLSTAYYHVFTGAAGQTLTLPSPASNNVQYVIINNTANTVTVAAATSTNIVTTAGTSVASITLIANQRVFILANGGTNYFQIF